MSKLAALRKEEKEDALAIVSTFRSATVPKCSSREKLKQHMQDFRFRLSDDLQHDHPLRHPKAEAWRAAHSVIALFKKHKELSYTEKTATGTLDLIEDNEALERQNEELQEKIDIIESQCNALTVSVKKLSAEKDLLEEQNRANFQRAEARHTENEEYLAELTAVRFENSQLRSASEKLMKAEHETTLEVESLRNERNRLAADEAKYTHQVEIVKGELAASNEILVAHRKEFQELEALIVQKDCEIVQLKEKLTGYNEMKAKYEIVDAEIQALKEQAMTVQEKLIKKTILNMRNMTYRTFLSTWHENVKNIKNARAESDRQQLIMMRFITKYQRAREHRIFDLWAGNVKDIVNQRRIVQKFLHKLNKRLEYASFDSWVHTVKEIKAKRNQEKKDEIAMKRFIYKYHRRHEHAVFDSWVDFVEDRKFERQEEARKALILQRFTRKLHRRMEYSVFNTWFEKVETKILARWHFQKMIDRFERREEFGCLQRWRQNVQMIIAHEKEAARQAVAMKRFISKYHRRHEHASYLRWVHFVEERKHERVEEKRRQETILRFVRRYQRRHEHAVLDAWVDYVAGRKADRKEEARQKAVMARFISKFHRKVEHSVFDSWCDFVIERKALRTEEARQQTILKRFSNQLHKRLEHAVLRTWKEKVQKKVLARKHFKKMITRFERKEEAAAVMQWRHQTAKIIAADIERKRNALIMAKFASRFKQRHEHMIFITWLANAKEQRHQRKIVKRFSQRLLNREKFMIYERWIEFVAEKKRIQKEEEKNRRLLDRFVKKFHRRTEHATLAQWIHFVEERKFERDEEKRQKYVMRRFINKVQQRDKMSIYDRWVAFVDDIKQERADDIERAKRRADEAEAERQEELRQERVLERFVRKFRKRVENAIFSTWSHKVRDKVAARKHMRRMISRFEKKDIAAGFLQWKRVIISLVRTEKEERENNIKLERFIFMMTKNTEIQVFRTWVQNAREQKRFRLENSWHSLEDKYNELLKFNEQQAAVIEKLMQGRSRLIGVGNLRVSINSWIMYKVKRQKARKTINQLLLSKERSAFIHWRDSLAKDKAEKLLKALAKAGQQEMEAQALKNQQELERYKRQRMEAFMRQLMQGELARTFRSWQGNAREIKRGRLIMNRFVKRWKNLELHRIFGKIQTFAKERKYNRRLAEKFFLQLEYKHEKMGFEKWLLVTVELKASREAEKREAQVRAELAAMTKQAEANMLKAAERAEEMKEEMNKKMKNMQELQAKRMLQTMMGDIVGKSFSAWRHFALKEAKNRSVVVQFVKRWKHQEVFSLFRQWSGNTRSIIEERVVIARFARRMLNRGMSSAFRKMHAYCNYRKRRRRNNERVRILYEDHLVKKMIRYWRANALEVKRIKKNTTKLTKQWQNRGTFTAFEKWRLLHDNRKFLRAVVHKGIERIKTDNKTSLARGFSMWNRFCDQILKFQIKQLRAELKQERDRAIAYRELTMSKEEQQQMANAKRLMRRLMGRNLDLMFNTWKGNVSKLKRERNLMKRMAFKMKNRTLSLLFDTWAYNVASIVQQRVVLSQFIRRWKNKELVKLFTAWRNNVSVILRQRHVLAKFIKQWQNKNTLKIFRHWHEKAALSAYRRTNSGRMNRLSNAFEAFCRKLSSAKKPKDLIRTVAELGPAVVQCTSVDIYLFNAQTGMYYSFFNHGRGSLQCPYSGKEGIVGFVARDGDPIILTDAQTHTSYCPEIDATSFASDVVGKVSRHSIEKLYDGNLLQYIAVPIVDQSGPTVAVIKATRVIKESVLATSPRKIRGRLGKKTRADATDLDEIACEALRMIGSVVRCSPVFPSQKVQAVEQKVMQWGSQITDALKEFDLSHQRISESLRGSNGKTLLNVTKIPSAMQSIKSDKRKKKKKSHPLMDRTEERGSPKRSSTMLQVGDLDSMTSSKKYDGKEPERQHSEGHFELPKAETNKTIAEHIFNQMDKDGNGVIDKNEFLAALQSASALSTLAQSFSGEKGIIK